MTTPAEHPSAAPEHPVDAERTRHPLSAAFGDLAEAETAELEQDIKRNGLLSPIVEDAEGRILDGWHRYRACLAAGVKPRFDRFSYVIEPAAEDAGRTMSEAEFVVAQNARRRHLTAEQRRKVIAEILKAEPERSNVAVAKAAGVTDKTVAAARVKLEATSEIPRLPKTTGRDGKARPVRRVDPTPLAPPVDQKRGDDGAADAVEHEVAHPAQKRSGRIRFPGNQEKFVKQLEDVRTRTVRLKHAAAAGEALERGKVETLHKHLLALAATLEEHLREAQ